MPNRARLYLAAPAAVLVGALIGYALAPKWSPVPSSPIPRFEGPGVVVQERIFLFGGFVDSELHATARVDAYDPLSGTWSRRADLPAAVTHLNGAVHGDKVWFAGGFAGDHPGKVVRSVWRYDATADRWETGPDLPAPRGGGALVRLGGALHYFGGFAEDRDSTPGDHWALDLAEGEAWRRLAPLPQARGHLGAAVLEGRIYAIGGQFRHDTNPLDVPYVHVYDARLDRWEALASLPEPRSHFEPGTLVLDGRIYICGGRNNAFDDPADYRHAMRDVHAYDPDQDRWYRAGRLPQPLLAPVVLPVGQELFLMTGSIAGFRAPVRDAYVGGAGSRYLHPYALFTKAGRKLGLPGFR